MASTLFISDHIRIIYKKNYQISESDNTVEEQYLFLSFIYNVNGETVDIITESRHRFVECNPLFLQAFMREKEPLPLDTLVDPQAAEKAREEISHIVASLVRNCVGVKKLKSVQVDVVVEVKVDEED